MLEFMIMELGFTKEEMNAINNHFLYRLDIEDWESITLAGEFEDVGEEFLKLPTGRVAFFPEELMRKEELSEID